MCAVIYHRKNEKKLKAAPLPSGICIQSLIPELVVRSGNLKNLKIAEVTEEWFTGLGKSEDLLSKHELNQLTKQTLSYSSNWQQSCHGLSVRTDSILGNLNEYGVP